MPARRFPFHLLHGSRAFRYLLALHWEQLFELCRTVSFGGIDARLQFSGSFYIWGRHADPYMFQVLSCC